MNQTSFSPLRKKLLWGILALILLGNIATAFLSWLRIHSQTGAPLAPSFLFSKPEGSSVAVYGPAPDFSLTERSGRVFSKTELLGKPWIADFIFTSCPSQCPVMSLHMRRLQNVFPPQSGFRFVSFTVDPERDTPQVLSEYADRYGAEKNRWFFLTGAKSEINRILKGFFLSSADEPAMHSIRFILVDAQGKIRGYYDSSEPGALKQLIHDAEILVKKTA